jgi:hydrogenase maturation protease
MKAAVLGVGSPFGDDRLGWEAVAALRREPAFAGWEARGLVTAEALDRPGIGLVSRLARDGRVVLVDAIRSGARPGTLHHIGLDELLACRASPASSHGIGLADALALARALDQLPARLVIFGVESGEPPDACLSAPVRAALPGLVRAILDHLLAELQFPRTHDGSTVLRPLEP